jgi:hypothetical protein
MNNSGSATSFEGDSCGGFVMGNWIDRGNIHFSSGSIVSRHSDLTIGYNLLTDNASCGIELISTSDRVHNNIVARTRPHGMGNGVGMIVGDAPSAVITNNVLYDNEPFDEQCCPGTELYYYGGPPAFERNMLYSSYSLAAVACNGALWPSSVPDTSLPDNNFFFGNLLAWEESLMNGCMAGFTLYYVNPVFCDASNDNWFIQPNSPCIRDTVIDVGGGDSVYYHGLIGALPVGCGTSDAVSVTFPPDDSPGSVSSGDVYALSGFTVTNISDFEAPIYYRLLFDDKADSYDQGDPLAFVGLSPVLEPGESFTPPEAALIVPEADSVVTSKVTYLVAYAPALNMPDTFVTTITFTATVPVAVQSFAGSWADNGVMLRWVTAPTANIREFEIGRSAGGSASQIVTDSPLPGVTTEWLDIGASPGTDYRYRLIADGEIVATVEVGAHTPGFALEQNVPNPFNPETRISFSLPERARAILAVFNVEGRRVTTLIDEVLPPGHHDVTWDGRDSRGVRQSTGLHFYRLQAGKLSHTRKMMLLK